MQEQLKANGHAILRGAEIRATARYQFEDFILDPDRRELTRGSESIAMGPQVFDLLLHLVGSRSRVVTKDAKAMGESGRDPQQPTVGVIELGRQMRAEGGRGGANVDHYIPDPPANDADQLALGRQRLEMQSANDARRRACRIRSRHGWKLPRTVVR